MSDIVADRPVSGQAISASWGAEVHDAIEGLQAGTVNMTMAGPTGPGVNIVFPRAYATPPMVFAAVLIGSARYFAIVSAVSTTGCSINATDKNDSTSSAALVLQWFAIGKPA